MSKAMMGRFFAALAVLLLSGLAWAVAPAGRYQINEAAGTVRDTKTGLTWQRAISNSTYNWANAKAYCQGLNLGSFSTGWRLPTKLELETLVDVRIAPPGPTIDTTAFPNTPAEDFSTSSLQSGSVWCVNFNRGGPSETCGQFNSYRVRCVR